MHRTILAAATLATAIAATPARAGLIEELQPGSQWSMDWAENKCRLVRFFGPENNRHLLVIEQFWPAETFTLGMAGPAFARSDVDAPTGLRYRTSQAPFDGALSRGEMKGFGTALFYTAIGLSAPPVQTPPASAPVTKFPMLDTTLAGETEFVALSQKNKEVRFRTGSLASAFKLLNQCTQDLVKFWGIDVERHLTATRMPVFVNEKRMATDLLTYIPFDKMGEERGIMRLRVLVSEAGAVEDCVLLEAPNIALLQPPVCKWIRKAKFEPALDAQGAPMRSYFATTITYSKG
ncbi:MAG: hypothetical protein KAF27_05150 [Porphyrobacter sp.]|nr:hypothetical protein [Porphyrobacter sp.]